MGRTDEAKDETEAKAPIVWPSDDEELTHWKRLRCWLRLRAEEKAVAEDDVVGWHHQFMGHEI